MLIRIVSFSLLAFAAPFAHAAGGLPSGTYMAGNLALTFADHGKLELKEKDQVVMDGTWSSDASKVTITDKSGSYACAAPNATGVYGWKMSGDTVTFTKQKDGCDDRASSLDGKSWKKS
jgi:hypothetical protein